MFGAKLNLGVYIGFSLIASSVWPDGQDCIPACGCGLLEPFVACPFALSPMFPVLLLEAKCPKIMLRKDEAKGLMM